MMSAEVEPQVLPPIGTVVPAPNAASPAPTNVHVHYPPAATPAPAAPPVLPVDPNKISIPMSLFEDLSRSRDLLAQVNAERAKVETERKQAEAFALAQKGELESALRKSREEAEQRLEAAKSERLAIEERAKRYALDAELGKILGEKDLVAGAAEQLKTLWRGNFVVEPQGETFGVRTVDHHSVGDWIAAQLQQPHYQHFRKPLVPGGGITSLGTQQTTPTPAGGPPPPPPPAPSQPMTLSEAAIMDSIAMQRTVSDGQKTGGYVPNQAGELVRQPGAAFGLKAIR